MQQPGFTIEEVRYADSNAVFDRALTIFESGKIGPITSNRQGYSAVIIGTHPYQVSVSAKRVDTGSCNCYLGQHDRLCKHILALALAVLHKTGRISHPRTALTSPKSPEEAKQAIREGMKKLRAYTGPSRVWFSYQRDLATGSAMIAEAVDTLPPTKQNAQFLWRLIERIDRKLANAVDDSDGQVSECTAVIIRRLADYAEQAPELAPTIQAFCKRKTSFDFEHDLQSILKQAQFKT